MLRLLVFWKFLGSSLKILRSDQINRVYFFKVQQKREWGSGLKFRSKGLCNFQCWKTHGAWLQGSVMAFHVRIRKPLTHKKGPAQSPLLVPWWPRSSCILMLLLGTYTLGYSCLLGELTLFVMPSLFIPDNLPCEVCFV